MDHPTARPEHPTLSRRTLRRLFLLALIPAVVLAGRLAESAEVTLATAEGDTWSIEIAPRIESTVVALQNQPAEDAPAPVQPAPSPGQAAPPIDMAGGGEVEVVPNRKFTMNGLTYRQIYESIPYSRAEYLANPSYRHEATMELLTGTPRQTVIHRTYEPKLNTPIEPQPQFLYNYYGGYGAGYGGYGPAIGFGYGLGYYRPQYAPAFRYFLPINYGL